ncbi:general secretion pathway protein L [Pseudomonas baetica]|uniref:Type II secretion system protein L n=1 Tax=Pseudomonas baetica TaxID=674054 RepID=A0ABX4PZ40_9PSED|nr:type II secretion system protein GspL [Pseudomonas baetica]PKA69792.1 general secretion pathway protein L [Pseudomonas baetica]PTC21447.1 type II secretory protein pull [Pseudomonas baetica]
MKTWLYLTAEGLPKASPDWPCCFWRDDEAPNLMPLANAATVLAGASVMLILPMEVCSWWLTDAWPNRRRPSVQALTYAIEDQLAQELDSVHVAVGRSDATRRYPLLVIDRQWLETLLVLLKSLGIEPASCYVDADLLPDDQPCGAWWFGRWIVGGTQQARLALTDQGRETLKENPASPVHWLNTPGSALTALSTVLARQSRHAIDLRQGEYAQSQRRLPWSLVGVAVGLTFLMLWGFTQARSHFLEQQAGLLYADSVERFRAIYPQETRIVDLAAQLRALQSQGDTNQQTRLARLHSLAEQVIGGSSVEVQRIEYRAGEGWKVQLTANSFAELEQLRERGRQSGMPIKLGSASKDQNRVRAILTLEESS